MNSDGLVDSADGGIAGDIREDGLVNEDGTSLAGDTSGECISPYSSSMSVRTLFLHSCTIPTCSSPLFPRCFFFSSLEQLWLALLLYCGVFRVRYVLRPCREPLSPPSRSAALPRPWPPGSSPLLYTPFFKFGTMCVRSRYCLRPAFFARRSTTKIQECGEGSDVWSVTILEWGMGSLAAPVALSLLAFVFCVFVLTPKLACWAF